MEWVERGGGRMGMTKIILNFILMMVKRPSRLLAGVIQLAMVWTSAGAVVDSLGRRFRCDISGIQFF